MHHVISNYSALLLFFVSFSSFSMEHEIVSVDELIADPLSVWRTCDSTQREYETRVKQHIKNVPLAELPGRIVEERKVAERKCPIFSLEECSKGFCCLTRSNNPRYRSTYEERVVSALYTLAATKETINYVSFGSSQLFQDAVILAKFLTRHPSTAINLHCIDIYYTPFCFALGLLYKDSSNALDIDSLPNFLDVIDELREKGKEDWNMGSVSNDDEELDKALLTRCENILNPFVQLHTFLTNAFPESSFTWNVFAHFKPYLEAIEQGDIGDADFLLAADITDFGSKRSHADLHYIELYDRIAQKNELVNIALDLPPSIVTLSNIPREGYESFYTRKSGSWDKYEMFKKKEPIKDTGS